MRYVRQAGSDPSFLRKALSEASGELRQQFYGIPRQLLLESGDPPDEDWSLLTLAVHLRDVEEGFLRQLEAILSSRTPEIEHVGLHDIPFLDDHRHEDAERVLEEHHYYRRHATYILWELSGSAWERRGIHPYRGELTITDLAREMYQHDLEHLWQAQRMVEALAAR